MPVSIPIEIIKEIAEYLDTGMKCFYHIHTGELEYYPDELRGHAVYDEEIWQEIIDKVEDNDQEYIAFQAIESHESFSIMEEFVAGITETRIRDRFEDAIAFRKPFQNFKQLLNVYPELRQQWFDHKNQKYIECVQEQLNEYNSLQKRDNETDTL